MSSSPHRIVVALSGGVDSSVAAALLKEAGYDVSGAFIVPWSPSWLPCTWREERRDAMRVAAHLRIPFHTVDLSHEYERDVVQTFVAEYRAGRTPNPDVLCNQHVKFGAFLAWALGNGFDAMATGHYARRERKEESGKRKEGDNGRETIEMTGRDHGDDGAADDGQGTVDYGTIAPSSFSPFRLLAGVDTSKDQSYFLWTLSQRELSHTLFPVGGYTKPEVRALAARFELPTAAKKDSQGVCFLGAVDMADFLAHYLPLVPGTVLDTAGVPIGTHRGTLLYTLGQRHGFVVHQASPADAPYYVVSKDVDRNTLTVAHRMPAAQRATGVHALSLTSVRWVADEPVAGASYQARYRYRQPLVPVVVTRGAPDVVVRFLAPQQYVACGQSLVLYNGSVCLGGGIIEATDPLPTTA